MDARHPLTELDRQMLDWCSSARLAVYLLLTKIDKLSRNQAAATLFKGTKETEKLGEIVVQPFSALDHTGVDQARRQILTWLE